MCLGEVKERLVLAFFFFSHALTPTHFSGPGERTAAAERSGADETHCFWTGPACSSLERTEQT